MFRSCWLSYWAGNSQKSRYQWLIVLWGVKIFWFCQYFIDYNITSLIWNDLPAPLLFISHSLHVLPYLHFVNILHTCLDCKKKHLRSSVMVHISKISFIFCIHHITRYRLIKEFHEPYFKAINIIRSILKLITYFPKFPNRAFYSQIDLFFPPFNSLRSRIINFVFYVNFLQLLRQLLSSRELKLAPTSQTTSKSIWLFQG